jgi:hypothetical protein
MTAELEPTEQFQWQEEDAYTLGVQAFVYAYPWVYMTKAVWDRSAGPGRPINTLTHFRDLKDAGHTAGGAPNNDTLYSQCWLWLDEPIILTVPDIVDRYYTFQFTDFMGDNFAYVGTRTTGTAAGSFAIVGPHWQGTLPGDVTELPRSDTLWAYVLGRTLVDGTDDLPAVHAIQDQYSLTPLSQWPGSRTTAPPSAPSIRKPLDRKTDPLADWKTINQSMAEIAPQATEAEVVQSYARIGVGPGTDVEQLSENTQRGLARAAVAGTRLIAGAFAGGYAQKQVNGWNYPPPATGRPSATRDWLVRAIQALAGFVANDPAEAIYLNVSLDDSGHQLSGTGRYEIRFENGGQPPVAAFWSITMYNLDYNLVANPINRYSLGDRSGMTTAPDGSLTLSIHSDQPSDGKLPNWLPAPAGDFFLFLRAYLPGPALLDQTWLPPTVSRLT